MKHKYIIIILSIILFCIGFYSGKYVQGAKSENEYPFHLRDVFVENQPSCATYKAFIKSGHHFDSSVVTNEKGDEFARLMTLDATEGEIKFVVSILNEAQEQFIDEVWLECEL